MGDSPRIRIVRLDPTWAAAYREFMLGAYAAAPHAFTSTVPEREVLPLAWWADRLGTAEDSPQLVCGALAGAELVGAAGLRFGRRVGEEPDAVRLETGYMTKVHMWRRIPGRDAE